MSKLYAVVYWNNFAVDGTMLEDNFASVPFEIVALYRDSEEAAAHVEEIAVALEDLQTQTSEQIDFDAWDHWLAYDVGSEKVQISWVALGDGGEEIGEALEVSSKIGGLSASFHVALDPTHTITRKESSDDGLAELVVMHEVGEEDGQGFDCAWGIVEVEGPRSPK